MKLLFTSPTYGPVDPQAVVSQRLAIMHAGTHAGVQWMADCSPDRMGFHAARNHVVELALSTDADAIFWCDSDIVLPVDAVSQLVREDKDFITGMYYMRKKPHWPLVAHYMPEKETFSWFTEWPENVVAPVDGCGFGCVLTSMAMLRALPAPWFHYEKFSEDFDFCRKAAKAGFQLFVHTGVQCGHLGDPMAVTASEFQAVRDGEGLERYLPRRQEQSDGAVRSADAA